MAGKRVQHRARRRVTPVLVAVLVTGVAFAWGLARLGAGVDTGPGAGSADDGPDHSASSSRSSTAGPAPGSASPSGPQAPAAAQVGRRSGDAPEAPTSLRLPSGTTLPVRSVTARADGVLDVPDDIRTAGWWRGGSRLGDPFGATLIAAHIDSRSQGLGPYVELLSIEAGAEIVVASKHLEQTFHVRSLQLVPRSSLAGATDLFSVSGPRRLVMVTCAGPFDAARGGYQNLAVVTARPAGPPSRRAG